MTTGQEEPRSATATGSRAAGRVAFGEFELDLSSGELRRRGVFVPLQAQVARALVHLVSRAGRLVPREELVEALWGETIVEYDQGLNNTIRTLRSSLGDDARSPRFVETSLRRGYRFIAPVTAVGSGGAVDAITLDAQGPSAAAHPAATVAARRSRVVAAAALSSGLALAVAIGSLWVALGSREPQPPTVAVVPFAGTGPNAEILGASLAEELTRELSVVAMAPLRVIGPASAARAFREESDVAGIARRLGASHLVVGSLVNKGDVLTLELRVLRAADGGVAWHDQVDPTWAEVLGAQRTLANRIAARLSEGIGVPALGPDLALPGDPGAIASYLEGRHLLARGSAAEALPFLEAVVRAEPLFAAGHTALGEAVLRSGEAAGVERALRLAAQALRLAPRDPRAHLLRAQIALGHEWDWGLAERHLDRALDLAPGDPSVHLARSMFLASLARHHEALAAASVAFELDPLSAVVQGDLAMLRFWTGDWPGVLRETARLLELDPEAGVARSLRFEALLAQRRWDEARSLAIALCGAGHGFQTLVGPGIGRRYLAVQEERWRDAEPGPLRAIVLASLAAERGRHDEALGHLGEAVRLRSAYVPFLAVDPHFHELADRVEFRRLLADVGHPLAGPAASAAGPGPGERPVPASTGR